MPLLPLLLLLVTTQVPCSPREFSDTCKCKQGMASACEALRITDPKLAAVLEAAAAQAVVIQQTSHQQATEASEQQAQESSNAPEPPDCKGQEHHIISRPIAKALEEHPVLRGHYTARDSRFVARAKDEKAHCGYQDWHRKVDQEVIQWLQERDKATPKQFEEFLRSIYKRPEMRKRFPSGF